MLNSQVNQFYSISIQMEKNSKHSGSVELGFSGALSSETKPIAAPLITIEVSISTSVLVSQYVKAFVRATRMRNSYLAQAHPIYDEDLLRYIAFLVKTRIEIVNGTFDQPIHKLSPLWIPTFVWHTLNNVGNVFIRNKGIKLTPVFDPNGLGGESGEPVVPMNLEGALSFSADTMDLWSTEISMSQKSMPKEEKGDEQVMACALIENKMRGLVDGVPSERYYLSGFLEMHLRKQNAFEILYRTQYVDISLIEQVLNQAALV